MSYCVLNRGTFVQFTFHWYSKCKKSYYGGKRRELMHQKYTRNNERKGKLQSALHSLKKIQRELHPIYTIIPDAFNYKYGKRIWFPLFFISVVLVIFRKSWEMLRCAAVAFISSNLPNCSHWIVHTNFAQIITHIIHWSASGSTHIASHKSYSCIHNTRFSLRFSCRVFDVWFLSTS